MTAAILAQLQACGVTITSGADPGTVQLALRGPLPPALRAAVRDRAALRDALDQEAAVASALIRRRRNGREVLRYAAHLLGQPVLNERLAAKPSRALYWGLGSAAKGGDPEAALLVAELVHGAVLQELEARYPGQPVEGALVRLGGADGPGALRDLFLAAADRLRPPAAGA
ncbi:MAG: hypothetical protein ACYDHB_13145 [Candidatus Dormibacteria bacterium]